VFAYTSKLDNGRIYETISMRYISEDGEELIGSVFPRLYIFLEYLRLCESLSVIALTIDLYIKEVGLLLMQIVEYC
jgi:hypothetical protein